MGYLSKDEILGAKDDDYEDVDVPEWGGKVRLRCISGSERDRYESSLAKMQKGKLVPDMVNARAKLVAMSVVDEMGNRMFSDTEVLALGAKSARALDRVYEVAARLSGIDEGDMERVKEDFGEDQSESSTSG